MKPDDPPIHHCIVIGMNAEPTQDYEFLIKGDVEIRAIMTEGEYKSLLPFFKRILNVP